MVSGTIETTCSCAHLWPSQTWAIAGGGKGLGGLTRESSGRRKEWKKLRGAFSSFPSCPSLVSFNPIQVTWRRDISSTLSSPYGVLMGTGKLPCD